ncbi:hypothetical protein, partial [Acrocarpospora pleiomorpha]|uniref:hypothetical protein n=1 Tax=Acrocarpospora pleiomorpha TaxID=90975 RepID=UPI0031DC111D
MEDRANHASLSPEWKVRYNKPGSWDLIWTLRNNGPGTAHDIQMEYSGTNFLCGTIEIPVDGVRESDGKDAWLSGADCVGGIEITEAKDASPTAYPGLHIREIENAALNKDLGLYSAVVRELAPGEMVEIIFSFKV